MKQSVIEFHRFVRYCYAYYLVAATFTGKHRPHPAVCEAMEAIVRATAPPQPKFQPFLPNRTRFFPSAKTLLLDRQELYSKLCLSRKVTESFGTQFLPTKHLFVVLTAFTASTTFQSWSRGKESTYGLWADVRKGTQWGSNLEAADYQFQGTVLTGAEPKRLLFHVSDNRSVEDALKQSARALEGQSNFDMAARISYIQSVLAQADAPREPDYWLGADVTALIDADSYAPLREKSTPGRTRFRAPFSDRLFVRAIDALCNNAGIYTLSLFRFPPSQFHPPIMKRWSELASHWARTAALPSGDQDGTYENRTESLIATARLHFATEYPFQRFGQLMSWLSIQINNANSVRIFTNVESSQTDIDRAWYFIRDLPHVQELAHFARAFGFSTHGNQSAGRLAPGDYAASYAFWSFAKAAPYKQRAPHQIDFLVSSQRLSSKEEPPVRQSLQADRLFPWGALLKTVLDELGECDADWLYTLLLDLRTYTLSSLEPLCDRLILERMQGIRNHQEKRDWLDRVMFSISEFVTRGLLEATMQCDLSVARTQNSALEILSKAIAVNRASLLRFLKGRELQRVKRTRPI